MSQRITLCLEAMLYNARVEISKSVKARCSLTSHFSPTRHGAANCRLACGRAGGQDGWIGVGGGRPGNYPLFRVSRGCRVSHVIYSEWDFPLNFLRHQKDKVCNLHSCYSSDESSEGHLASCLVLQHKCNYRSRLDTETADDADGGRGPPFPLPRSTVP